MKKIVAGEDYFSDSFGEYYVLNRTIVLQQRLSILEGLLNKISSKKPRIKEKISSEKDRNKLLGIQSSETQRDKETSLELCNARLEVLIRLKQETGQEIEMLCELGRRGIKRFSKEIIVRKWP